MEFAIAVFIGVWITASVVLAYIGLKKDYEKEGLSGGKSCGRTTARKTENGRDA